MKLIKRSIVVLLILVIAVSAVACDGSKETAKFEYWNECDALTGLTDYVAAVTDEKSKDYIPEKDRIAVFDMDGTLMCETYYTYYDTMMFIEYCLYDHPERVSDELKAVAASIKPGYTADETLARNFAKAYAGMTVSEFYDYVVSFGQKQTQSFNNMRYIDNFYLPMVEVVKFLYENGFDIWVISGTERTTTRAIVANSPIKDYVTPDHVIGTDFEVKVKGHEDEPSNMDFKYATGDDLVLTGGFVQKNLNANKSIYIEREIGQRPVLAFGNSGSDTSMLNYAIDERNPYKAGAYMVVADDTIREWGPQDWATKSAEYISKGYTPISMKNDFKQIYPEGITKAQEQYVEKSVDIGGQESLTVFETSLDYSIADNWAYFAEGEDKQADVFFVCPAVDTRSYANAEDLNEKLKGRFVSAIDAEKGIYSDDCRFYSPYYRQMSVNAPSLSEADFKIAESNAFLDVEAAFRYYLDNENEGRPIILAGFSQGAEMCVELLKSFFGNTDEGAELASRLIAVYAIGWRITDEDIASYPQIVPASGESDVGCVISYECEDGSVTGSVIIPEGVKTRSINPLNWKTDGTPADASLNKGALFSEEEGALPGFCGAYIDENRGSLVVTGVSTEDYPKKLAFLPDGSFHIYDNMFFYTNLKENVALRTQTYLAK